MHFTSESARRPGPPPFDVDRVLDELKLGKSSVVAMRSSKQNRWILGIEQSGRLGVVAKCGAPDDQGLVKEADLLRALAGSAGPYRVPEVVHSGLVDGRFVLAMKAVPALRTKIAPSLETIAAIATSLTRGVTTSGPLVHGDLAPWNLVVHEGTTWLLDWEAARRERAPMWDLAHYTIRLGALVGRLSVLDVYRLLTMPGGVGARHLSDIGEDPGDATDHLRAYLVTSDPFLAIRAERFRQELQRLTS